MEFQCPKALLLAVKVIDVGVYLPSHQVASSRTVARGFADEDDMVEVGEHSSRIDPLTPKGVESERPPSRLTLPKRA